MRRTRIKRLWKLIETPAEQLAKERGRGGLEALRAQVRAAKALSREIAK